MSDRTSAQHWEAQYLDAVAKWSESERATRAELEALDDGLCDALMAARSGTYDGLTVEQHLERLVQQLRRQRPE